VSRRDCADLIVYSASDGHHGLSQEWRHARKSRRHGQPRLHPHHAALRPATRRREPGRSRAHSDL